VATCHEIPRAQARVPSDLVPYCLRRGLRTKLELKPRRRDWRKKPDGKALRQIAIYPGLSFGSSRPKLSAVAEQRGVYQDYDTRHHPGIALDAHVIVPSKV